ncbi:MAG TPA: isoaspartyl peptidase/L-asparaginase [Caldimonas sp.]|nr:isoaspartyl peptidase/L-asparaginase [Caldimonas sp.]
MTTSYVLALHGGAGTIPRGAGHDEGPYRKALLEALAAGEAVLAAGGTSLDAVVETVRALEDCPLFNAGHGAVFNAEGSHELDAAVMDGRNLAAGGVAAARRIRNPVLAAREVLRTGRSVLLGGEGADRFAEAHGLAMVEPAYFSTPHRHAQWRRAREMDAQLLDHDAEQAVRSAAERGDDGTSMRGRVGTVGAVALDRQGHLAAATSTGGMTNKPLGRIGDSPIVGAGVYANDASCAVSTTGTGEHFVRACVAHDVHARMRYRSQTLDEAVEATIAEGLEPIGGVGGVIAIDAHGTVVLRFNSVGMYRAWTREGGRPVAAVFES